MKRLFVALLAALPLLAFGQGLTSGPPGRTAGGKVLASYPLSTTGPLITEDANTVAHVYWNGTALVDTKGNSWTMNGTVPQVTANPFTTTRYGAGPFSALNYYSLAAGSVMSFAGDYTCHGVFTWSGVPTTTILADNWTASVGWLVQVNESTVKLYSNGTAIQTTAVPSAGPNIASWGRSGGNQYVKLNTTTTINGAAAYTANSGNVTKIGTGTGASIYTINVYEIICSTTAFTEASVLAVQQKVLGHFDGSSALTVTRATTATYAPLSTAPQTLYTVALGVARFTDQGMLVEPARTNSIRKSNTISAANAFDGVDWIAWPAEAVVDVTTTTEAAPGGGTYHTITNEAGATDNTGQAYQTASAGTSSAYWVASAWIKKPTGEDTTHASLHIGCGAGAPVAGAANCLCYRSDGGACTASTVAVNYCQALVADLSTTPVRLTVGVRCDAALTQPIVALVPGSYGVSIGITDFSGVQAESTTSGNLYSTSNVVTTTAAVARNADSISATVPSVAGGKWCIATTASLTLGTTWTVEGTNSTRLWSLGTHAAANTEILTPAIFDGYDSAGTRKYWQYTAPVSAGTTPLRFIACSVGPAVTISGTPYALTAGGAGNQTFTPTATTLYFGTRSAGGNHLSGYLKNLKICKATKAKDCS